MMFSCFYGIANAGRPVAVLTALKADPGPRPMGGWRDKGVWIAEDFDDPLRLRFRQLLRVADEAAARHAHSVVVAHRRTANPREALRQGTNQVFVSSASAWEIAIKQSLGKLRAPADLKAQIQTARFEMLNVTIDHALAVGDLPAHHSDPFDRILVAQALFEELTMVTQDPKIHRYGLDALGR